MKNRRLVTTVLVLLLAWCRADAGVLRLGFDQGRPTGVTAIRGDWAVADGAYVQRDRSGYAYRFAAADAGPQPTALLFEAKPLQKNEQGFLSFGALIDYVNKGTWAAVRFGSYGRISLIWRKDGKKRVVSFAPFRAEAGRVYRVAVVWREDRLAVFLDEALKVVLRAPWPSRQRRVGLFTESRCAFDNLVLASGADALRLYEERKRAAVARAPEAPKRSGPRVERGVFRDAFTGASSSWKAVKGLWRVRDEAYEVRAKRWGRYTTLAPVEVTDAEISGVATPLSKGVHGHASFGVVPKYVDSSNWFVARFGQYGGVTVLTWVDGKRRLVSLAKLSLATGRRYRWRVVLKGDALTLYLDGKRLARTPAPLAGRAGRPGLYAESSARFDDVSVTGARPITDEPPPKLAAKPRLKLLFAGYRPTLTRESPSLGKSGVLFAYVRNEGAGPAQLREIRMQGEDLEGKIAKGEVAWFRQKPFRIAPGAVGELRVMVSRLSVRDRLALFERPDRLPTLPVSFHWHGGATVSAKVPLTDRRPPLQINFMALDEGLRRLYVYLQRDPSGASRTFHVDRVLVNGRDVTRDCRFGRKVIADAVVPMTLDLHKPFRKGEDVVVCVGAREGAWAGHAVRALPGKFHIQVVAAGNPTRPDAIDDIWRHGFTCVAARSKYMAAVKMHNLESYPYSRSLAGLRRFDRPGLPPVAGVWLDEMDKPDAPNLDLSLRERERVYRREGRPLPLQMVNLCRPRIAKAIEQLELVDAVCSAYGFHGGVLGEGFGRQASLPWREYRLARRPFTPYFRNAEAPVFIDPASKRVIDPPPERMRCMEPREERWMTYGCLIHGAKGFMHWQYGTCVYKPPNWFSKTHTVIRAAMGGPLNHNPHGYRIPREVSRKLAEVWAEIGRINCELNAAGPLIAVSDVSRRARVVRADPERGPDGAPSADCAALVSGLDTIVLVVLNHNMKTNRNIRAARGVEFHAPVDVTVELRVPPWLTPRYVRRVRWDGVTTAAARREGDRMLFRIERLDVSDLIVITQDAGVARGLSVVDRYRERGGL